jgi:hypothetical protein
MYLFLVAAERSGPGAAPSGGSVVGVLACPSPPVSGAVGAGPRRGRIAGPPSLPPGELHARDAIYTGVIAMVPQGTPPVCGLETSQV